MTGTAAHRDQIRSNALSDAGATYMAGRGLSPKEAATYLGLSVSTIAKLRVIGDGPAYVQAVQNGAVRYRVVDLDEWMHQRTVRSTSDRQHLNQTR